MNWSSRVGVFLTLLGLVACHESPSGITQSPLQTLRGHEHIVSSVAFSPDGRTLASSSWDGSIKIWNPTTGQERATYHRHTGYHWFRSISFSPDGKLLVAASSDSTAMLVRTDTGEVVAILRGHTGQVWSTAYAPDGGALLTGGEDGTIHVWDGRTGHHLTTVSGHTAPAQFGGSRRPGWSRQDPSRFPAEPREVPPW